MKTIRTIRIENLENYLITTCLKGYIGFELKLLMRKTTNQYLDLLKYLIDYFIDIKPVINDGETIAYHSWLLKFVFINDLISLYEAQPDGNGFVEGADYAISVINVQKQECIKYNITPLFPLFNQMIVLSEGVLAGNNIDAVRYPSPNHMTGWWLTTELYDEDIKSLKTIHYYHLVFKRPDILRFLALPFGFRFLSGEQTEVWFDENVLS